ncbi:MAG: AAA family ATPase [Desulfovibrionaceae bacterium]|nr:AAA family ATPase [Desulfovibrionaceae bacterium]
MSHIGLCDTPLERSDDDRLGLARYASALARFAEQCETPITIALQGDWGSGKTSLMNLIREQLEKKERCACVWFNTWQYSQFGLENQLAASLISFFINALPDANTEGKFLAKKVDVKKIATYLGRLTLALGSVGGLPGAIANTAGSVMLADQKDEKAEGDPAVCIADLKGKLTELVGEITHKNTRRIVVFIDDLDRLSPAKAVELLEAFKLFLDIRGCVFFLACDYKVINQGLRAKFGAEIASNNEKSFFDKIIQLPFKMPVLQYEVDKYIGDLLKKIDIKYDDSDIEKYEQLIVNSLGFNPRGLKRAFNTLLLLKQVADVEYDPAAPNTTVNVKQNEKDRLIFAIICMQLAYEFFYNFVYKLTAEELVALFGKLRDVDKSAEDGDISKLLKELNDGDIGKLLNELNTEYKKMRFQGFIEALFNAMQLKFDNQDEELSQEEAQVFLDMLQLSQVTSTEEVQDIWQEKQDPKVRAVNTTVCDKLKAFLDEKYPRLKGRLRRHQPRKGKSDMAVILLKPRESLSWIGVFLSRTGKSHTPYCFSIDVGLNNDNNNKNGFEILQNLLKNPWFKDKPVNLQIKSSEDKGTFVSLYQRNHSKMDVEDLYQEIKPLAHGYFDVLLQT